MLHEASEDKCYYPNQCSLYALLRAEDRTLYTKGLHVTFRWQFGHQGSRD